MKISYNWLNEIVATGLSAEEMATTLTGTGLEVESIEEFNTVKNGLKGCVIGHVVDCMQHPNADKLRTAKVDIGTGPILSIVCGASNIANGQKVVVATIGSTLYPTEGGEINIKEAKIRGEISQGMICSESELGLGKSKDGIIVLSDDAKAGQTAAEYFQLETDRILEIGLTPNRGDAASHIGVARDLKAALGLELSIPTTSGFIEGTDLGLIDIMIDDHKGCLRYSGLVINNIKIEDSPKWLKNRLLSLGITPINNVVDITNLVMLETGQPLHAFDYDRLKNKKIKIRTGFSDQEFTTLDGVKRKLSKNDLMICDGEDPVCIAGVFGGENSGISQSTNQIFLESACFHPDYVRKTVQYHSLKTDAAFRFERGTDPSGTIHALKRAAHLLSGISDAKAVSPLLDVYPQPALPHKIEVNYKYLDKLIGISIDRQRIMEILTRLDFSISDETESGFLVSVPTYRVEVKKQADVAEEILRIYGLDNIPLSESLTSGYIAEHPEKDMDQLEEEIGKLLVSNGFYEILNNSLTKSSYTPNSEKQIRILNKLSEDLDCMRESLIFQMLESMQFNVNRRQKNLKLFEFGKTYKSVNHRFEESKMLCLAVSGSNGEENWATKIEPVRFHHLLQHAQSTADRLGLGPIKLKEDSDNRYSYCFKMIAQGKPIGSLGQVSKQLLSHFDLKQDVFIAEFNWSVMASRYENKTRFKDIPKFPEVRRDLSLVLNKDTNFSQIEKVAFGSGVPHLQKLSVFDVYQGDRIEQGKKSYSVSFTLSDPNNTMTDKVIDSTMQTLIGKFEAELGAIIRK